MYEYMHVYICHNFIHQLRKIFEGSIYSNSIKETKFQLIYILFFMMFLFSKISRYSRFFNML